MSRAALRILALSTLLLVPTIPLADAEKSDWFGDWAMDHDGHVGTLRIAELKADCVSPPWCDMALSYLDSKNVRHSGRINTIDGRGQHMRFTINFPGNSQRFDAYIFSFDKRKLAGTTIWRDRTFGFFATKK